VSFQKLLAILGRTIPNTVAIAKSPFLLSIAYYQWPLPTLARSQVLGLASRVIFAICSAPSRFRLSIRGFNAPARSPEIHHSREGGNPVDSKGYWIRAFAGMTGKVV
jgi:hypothetical protein